MAVQLVPAYLTADSVSFLGTRHRIPDAVLKHSCNAADPHFVVAGPARWPADAGDVGALDLSFEISTLEENLPALLSIQLPATRVLFSSITDLSTESLWRQCGTLVAASVF